MKGSGFALLFASTVFTLLAAEGVLRIVLKENGIPRPPDVAEVDAYGANPYVFKFRPYLWSYIPGSHYLQIRGLRKIPYEINAAGFRGPPIKRKSGKRLLVVGDSVVEGQGVQFNETFAERLSARLKPVGWEAINLGVSGASPIFYAANLERYLSFSPDAVLIALFENDIAEDRVRETEYRTLPVLDKPEALTGDVPSFFGSFRLVELARRMKDKLPSAPLRGLIVKNINDRKPATVLDKEFVAASPHLIGPDAFPRSFSGTARYLEYVRRRLEERGIPLLITSFGYGIFETDAVEVKHRSFVKQFNQAADEWAHKKQLPYLGLQPIIDEMIAGHERDWSILVNDGHPTAAAHDVIAEALFPWVAAVLHTVP